MLYNQRERTADTCVDVLDSLDTGVYDGMFALITVETELELDSMSGFMLN